MSVEVVRGFAGTLNEWNMGQESGFIAYMRGSIGDKPKPQETIVLGDTKALYDVPVPAETALVADGKLGGDSPSLSESWTITNS